MGIPGGGKGMKTLSGTLQQGLVIAELNASKNPHALERGRRVTGIEQCVVARLQKQSVLRVHQHRLARRYPEKTCIEVPDLRNDPGMAGLVGPAFHRFDRTAIGHQPCPESGQVLTAGQAAVHADDRNPLVIGVWSAGRRCYRCRRRACVRAGSRDRGRRLRTPFMKVIDQLRD
ncbi:hypothetical protein D3C75_688690 [compost metagenome]